MKTPWLIAIFSVSLLSLGIQLLPFLPLRSSPPLSLSPLDSQVNETARAGFHQTTYELYHVKNTITKHRDKFAPCWQSYLAAPSPSLEAKKSEGSLKVDWLISPQGYPSKVELVSSDFNDAPLASCIIEAISRLSFPPPPSAGVVYTSNVFNFKKTE
jgi:hypothetical protein